eukprot:6214254-Pleurochrysis_carterae.AAC.2
MRQGTPSVSPPLRLEAAAALRHGAHGLRHRLHPAAAGEILHECTFGRHGASRDDVGDARCHLAA